MAHECQRAFQMLKAGSPLGKTLKGRIGFELRMIIVGGQLILQKLDGCKYDVFNQRPLLDKKELDDYHQTGFDEEIKKAV